ncbi:hypothetical protein HRbin27_00165 [bacterium HR27]|nr:hypothetical protein HRbin27_00165 [bacterium HR27]
MAETRTVTVSEVEERTSQNGKRFWRVKVAGEKQALFCWDAALAEALLPGQTYVVTVNGSSEYPRIVDVTIADTAPAPATPAPAPGPAGERERRMLRMSALRAAADVLHGTAVPASELVAYAEQLLAWLEQ